VIRTIRRELVKLARPKQGRFDETSQSLLESSKPIGCASKIGGQNFAT
jgi:hypothetical protein